MIFLLCGIGLSGCVSKNELVNVDSEQVNNILEARDEINFLYIGRPTCPTCQEFQPVLEEVISQLSVEIFYYNTDDVRAESEDELMKLTAALEVETVPTLLKIENGVVINEMTGMQTKTDIKTFLTE